MTTRTLRALKASIAHWKRMSNCIFLNKEEPGAKDCALCDRFMSGRLEKDQCNGCPVKERTGHLFCKQTPFENAYNAFWSQGSFSIQFHQAALKEVAFLESLLPKESTKKVK